MGVLPVTGENAGGNCAQGVARRADARNPTVRHHQTQIGNHACATAGEQHGLSLEARAIQKLSLRRR